MRIIVDTNVFVSAAMCGGSSTPSQTVFSVIRKHQLLVSEATKIELFRSLTKPKLTRFISQSFVEWLSKAIDTMETVTTKEIVVSCRDPDDDKFLELAINGHADLIISGDNDLLVLHPFRGIPILTPAQFLALAD